jgi:hypothetical protein
MHSRRVSVVHLLPGVPAQMINLELFRVCCKVKNRAYLFKIINEVIRTPQALGVSYLAASRVELIRRIATAERLANYQNSRQLSRVLPTRGPSIPLRRAQA